MFDDFLAECHSILEAEGLRPEPLLTDGKLHRCPTVEKPYRRDGAYIIHLSDYPTVWWLHWATGSTGSYSPKQHKTLTLAERRAFAEQMARDREQRELEIQQRHHEAALRAATIWGKARQATNSHAYLLAKGVGSHGLKCTTQGFLVLTVQDKDEKICSLQFISPDGANKPFLTGGKTKGCFFPIGEQNLSLPLCICEGYATGASIHEATGYEVLVAFYASNLLPVAQVAREKFLDRTIILCADNDLGKEKNTGIDAATEAAREITGMLAVPKSIDAKPIDFNDLHKSLGLDSVKKAIEDATAVRHSDPVPLRRKTEEQAPYPIEALGAFAAVAHAIAEHVAVPISMVAGAILAILSLCTQGKSNVVHEGYTVLLSLYCLTIAESGARKSTVDAIVGAGVRQYEQEQRSAYETAMEEWKIKSYAYETAKKNLSRSKNIVQIQEDLEALGPEPVKPAVPRLLVSNVNSEGVYRLLQEGCDTLGIFCDEAGIIFGGTAFSHDNRLKTIAFLSSIWSTGCADKVRLVEGDSSVQAKRLAVHLMMQPIVARPIFADTLLQEQGFLPRFLVTFPKSLKGSRIKDGVSTNTIEENSDIKDFYSICNALLKKKVHKNEHGVVQFCSIILSQDAEIVYRNFYNKIELEQSEYGTLANVSSHAARCAEHALRIAGVLTLASDHDAHTIDATTMTNATQIAEWYLFEAKRIVEDAGVSEEVVRAERLLHWLHHTGKQYVIVQQMVQYTSLKDTKTVKQALELLAEHGYVRQAPKGIIVDGKKTNNAWEILKD